MTKTDNKNLMNRAALVLLCTAVLIACNTKNSQRNIVLDKYKAFLREYNRKPLTKSRDVVRKHLGGDVSRWMLNQDFEDSKLLQVTKDELLVGLDLGPSVYDGFHEYRLMTVRLVGEKLQFNSYQPKIHYLVEDEQIRIYVEDPDFKNYEGLVEVTLGWRLPDGSLFETETHPYLDKGGQVILSLLYQENRVREQVEFETVVLETVRITYVTIRLPQEGITKWIFFEPSALSAFQASVRKR
jgi:hypothetical protein